MPTYFGPTVREAAESRLAQIAMEIEELEMERRIVKKRLWEYRDSTMLEAERKATAAEPFQATPLPTEETDL